MNQMPHQADNNTVANTSPVHAENLPVTVAAAHTITPQALVQQGATADKSLVAPKPATTGKAPVPTAAAAIQMEQEAAAGQARQSADKLLRKKRFGESEGDQNAESSADSSYDVVAANTTEAATPAEEAAAAGGSSTAASSGAAWLPIAGGGLGLAAIGGGGGAAAAVTAAAVTAPTVSTFAVSIGAVAGPVTAALNYKIYDAQGNVVASGLTDATGKVTANIPVTYAGQALLIKITDANGTAPDFRSETADAAGGGTSLGSTAFRAAFVATGSTQSITVSPITELAVQKMGITTDAATVSAATVTATNASVGASLGVADILGAVTTVLSGDYNEANGLSAAEIYGQLLAKFDGQDHTAGGSVGATLAAFLAAINTTDAVARQTALNDLLTAGAAKFEAGVNTGAVTLINSPTLIISDGVAGIAKDAVTYTFTFSDAVTRSGDLSGTQTIEYYRSGGTATAGSDYIDISPGILTFAAGETFKTVTVKIVDDAIVEATETLTLNLRNASGGAISTASGTASIVDNDGAVGATSYSIGTVSGGIYENADVAAYTITRGGDLSAATTSYFRTNGGTALAGSDYTAIAAQTLSWGIGENSKVVFVSLTDDVAAESSETLIGQIATSSDFSTGTATATVTLLDNDTAASGVNTYTISAVGNNYESAGVLGYTITRSGDLTISVSLAPVMWPLPAPVTSRPPRAAQPRQARTTPPYRHRL